ncbi:hypothetical protein [Olleya aquimaris]|uniref:Uncharacterized protein n=1 Tax=Olleya aquimaris TaxID=639310 RepID=A0A327RFZ7_9FLAO|nr:hypothetical protein [Olleya aquimaris]RAJ14454.1 hypothetical protein LY08_01629 [Olleya aquimaris]
MKNFKLILLTFATAALFFTGCEDELEAPGTNYVTFEQDRTLEVVPDGTSTFDVMVYSANFEGSDRTFTVQVSDASTADPSTYNVPSTVTIPANSNVGKLQVTATDVDLDLANAKTVILNLVGGDGLSVDNGITLSLLEQCLFNKVVLNITFDSWPEEVYWAIYDSNGNLVAENGPYSPYANAYAGLSGSLASTLCLESGTYQFVVTDDFADGAGPISLSTLDGVTLFSSSGAYGAGTSGMFTLP